MARRRHHRIMTAPPNNRDSFMKWLPAWFLGECLGTGLFVFFGCGSICAAVSTGAQVGVFQVAIVWGLGYAIAIQLTGALSGAHLNPAVTLALMLWRGFPRRRVVPYAGAQLLGAFLAAAVLFGLFAGALDHYEKVIGLRRGTPGSEATAMVFGEFYPSPAGRPLTPFARQRMSGPAAFAAETLGTGILVLVILGVTRNPARPRSLSAATIGLTLTLLISLFGPLTMAGFNPARDLGPRLFSALAGWGSLPFRVNGLGWFTVYVLGPLLGGALGGAVYHFGFRSAHRDPAGQE
jgi:glycerol uptake facilitator protein